jgi:CO/xanthine dehydrogenase Mo-binding subunit
VKNRTAFSRRDLLKSGGALIVSFAFRADVPAQAPAQAAPPADVDSFLAIHIDGRVTIFTSRVDVGTGIQMAYQQIAAEELGIPIERFSVVEGDTAVSPDHGGTGGSSGIPRGGADIRRAAATARRALLEMGAKQLNRPASELAIAGAEVRPVSGGSVESVVALPEPGQQIALQLLQVVARRELVRGPMAKIEAAFNPCQRLIRLAV